MGGNASICNTNLATTNKSIAAIKLKIEQEPKLCATNLANITAKVTAAQEHFASSENPPDCNNYINTQQQISLISGQIATANAACANNTSSTQNLVDQSTNNANVYKKSTSALTSTLNTAKKSYSQIIQSLKTQISELQTQYTQLLDAKNPSGANSCSTSLASAQAKIVSLSSQINAASAKQPPVTNCTEVLNNAKNVYQLTYNNLQSQLNTMNANNLTLQNKLTQLSTAVNQSKSLITSDSQSMATLTTQYATNAANLSLTNTKINNTNGLIKNANYAINKTTQLNNALNAKYKIYQNQINNFQSQTAILNNDDSQINTLITIATDAIGLQNVVITLNNLVGPNGLMGAQKAYLVKLWGGCPGTVPGGQGWQAWAAYIAIRITILAMYMSKIYMNLETAYNNIMWEIWALNQIISSGGVSNETFTKYIQYSIGGLNAAVTALNNIIGGNPSTKYTGDNGSASGNVYCSGTWGNGTTNKFMACTGGVDETTGVSLNCTQTSSNVDWSFYCNQNLYALAYEYAVLLHSENGPLNGPYCSSADPNGTSMTFLNNLKYSVETMINDIKPIITSLQSIQHSSYSTYSTLTNPANTKLSSASVGNAIKYIGDNGSVDGNTYCSGSYGNTTNPGKNKNMKCLYGVDSNGNQIPCNITGSNVDWAFYCLPNTTLSLYTYVGAYNDQLPRAIPNQYKSSVTSVDEAMNVAISLGATVFGIQGGYLFYNTSTNVSAALAEAKKYGQGPTKYGNASVCSANYTLGCGWVNQVYVISSF